ncbi:proton channel OTOP3 isoform X2 [Python bivittatus]|uniref:Proton channel OTOP3 isoform X2 n=1 Tax=Python bivittatus TaxID=176946 RepID=A0A9F3QTD3_PYTBI|nr:proton channel OTOP3 isoform X2 [Python bivittatus]
MNSKEIMGEGHQLQEAGDEPMTTQPEPWKIHSEKSWLHQRSSSLLHRDKQAQKTGQLFSGILAMNVVFLGSAFICSMIFNKVAITVEDVWIFLSILKILSLSWMAYYLVFTRRKPYATWCQDAHAGAKWIKGSLILFGACSVVLHSFRIGYDIFYVQGKSHMEILFPSIEILFICIQTYFIWCHAKDCTQVQHNLTRCGLMLTLATNLLLWLLAVTNDTVHREIESELNQTLQRYEATVATHPIDMLNGIILAYSVNLIIQHISQNIFIIEGLHRQPLLVSEDPHPAAHSTQGPTSTQVLPNEDRTVSHLCKEPAPSTANEETDKSEKEKCEDSSPNMDNLEERQEIQRVSWTYIQTYRHLNWKRRALKEISSFLIMCNIILWIMPSFGAHPVFENGIEKSFYGYSTWFAIVNFGLPLGVFYRMHSVGDLLEVYRSA